MLKSVIVYFQYFTAIPIRRTFQDFPQTFKKGVTWVGVFGLVYGALMGLVYGLLRLRITLDLAWPVIMVTDIFLTNFFHYDALADTADGIFSNRDRDQMLRIMKDSRIGSNGTLAIAAYILLAYVFGKADLSLGQTLSQEILRLIAIFGVSKGALSLTFYQLKYVSALPKSSGQFLEGIETWRILASQGTVVIYLGLGLGLSAVISYLITLNLIFCYRAFIYRRLDGMNGDTMGASALLSQLIYLIMNQVMG